MSDPDAFVALLADLHSLAKQARANGDTFSVNDSKAHYWFGVAAGYEDAAERLEDELDEDQQQVS